MTAWAEKVNRFIPIFALIGAYASEMSQRVNDTDATSTRLNSHNANEKAVNKTPSMFDIGNHFRHT
jgi:hypothetical protein